MISREELKGFEIFEGLTDDELECIREIAKKEVYEAEKRIFEENSLAINLYLVLKGRVIIQMRASKYKERVPIDVIEQGEIFGWSAVTEPYTFTAAAFTMMPSELVVINGDLLRDLFRKNNHIGYLVMSRIASVISSRLRRLHEKLVEIS